MHICRRMAHLLTRSFSPVSSRAPTLAPLLVMLAVIASIAILAAVLVFLVAAALCGARTWVESGSFFLLHESLSPLCSLNLSEAEFHSAVRLVRRISW